ANARLQFRTIRFAQPSNDEFAPPVILAPPFKLASRAISSSRVAAGASRIACKYVRGSPHQQPVQPTKVGPNVAVARRKHPNVPYRRGSGYALTRTTLLPPLNPRHATAPSCPAPAGRTTLACSIHLDQIS